MVHIRDRHSFYIAHIFLYGFVMQLMWLSYDWHSIMYRWRGFIWFSRFYMVLLTCNSYDFHMWLPFFDIIFCCCCCGFFFVISLNFILFVGTIIKICLFCSTRKQNNILCIRHYSNTTTCMRSDVFFS